MRAKLLILGIISATVIVACSKDAFTTTPKLTFKGVSTTVLMPNGTIQFQLNYTDKEGDIQSHIYVQKITKNCSASDFSELDSIPKGVPTKANSKGEIDLDYAYGPNLGFIPIKEPQCQGQNDTCVFRFALTDLANHTSDTVTSPEIIIIKR
jgi:hypothetical protein